MRCICHEYKEREPKPINVCHKYSKWTSSLIGKGSLGKRGVHRTTRLMWEAESGNAQAVSKTVTATERAHGPRKTLNVPALIYRHSSFPVRKAPRPLWPHGRRGADGADAQTRSLRGGARRGPAPGARGGPAPGPALWRHRLRAAAAPPRSPHSGPSPPLRRPSLAAAAAAAAKM